MPHISVSSINMEGEQPNLKREEFDSMTIEVETPDGILYYTICENNEQLPIKVISTFGKAGTVLASWAYALDAMVSILLERKVPITEIIEKLTHISHSKPIRTETGVRVGSGPEGMAVALMEYRRQKFKRLQSAFDGPFLDG